MDCSPPGSSVHRILQARVLEWVAISFSRGSFQPRNQTWVSCIAGRFLTDWAMREYHEFLGTCKWNPQRHIITMSGWNRKVGVTTNGETRSFILTARNVRWDAPLEKRVAVPIKVNMPLPCCCCWVASVASYSVRPHRRQPTRLPRPWDSPGKNTGVSCHFLLQCVKGKSLSRVQLLATPWTAAFQAPPSTGFSRQEYWSGVPSPSPIGPCNCMTGHWFQKFENVCSHQNLYTNVHRSLSVSAPKWEQLSILGCVKG